MSASASRRLTAVSASIVLVVVVSACREPSVTPRGGGVGAVVSDSIVGLSGAALLAYARGRGFDTAAGAGDMQRLMVGRCPGSCRYGPRVRIQPESTTYRIPDTLELAKGYVIARFINLDSTEGYPKLSLGPRDTVYWIVDKVAGQWRSRYRSVNLARAEGRDSTTLHAYRGHVWRQSRARWFWSDIDEAPWGTCGTDICCSPYRSDG